LSWAGHRQPVIHLAFTADGKRLLSGSGGTWRFPHRLLTWDAATWHETGRERLSEDDLQHPAPASPDHKLALVVRPGGTLYLHNRSTKKDMRKLEATLKRYTPENSLISPNGHLAVLECDDRPGTAWLRLLDLRSGRTVCDLPAAARWRYLAFAPDNRHVAWFERDDTVGVLELKTGKILWELGTPRQCPPSVQGTLAFSPDGRYLASWSALDNAVRVWALLNGKLHCLLPGEALRHPWGKHCALAFSPDGKTLAVGLPNGDNAVDLWELATGRRRRQLRGHVMPVTALAFSPDGRRLASGSADTTVLVWDLTGR
jgi:WD40 repeat protein